MDLTTAVCRIGFIEHVSLAEGDNESAIRVGDAAGTSGTFLEVSGGFAGLTAGSFSVMNMGEEDLG